MPDEAQGAGPFAHDAQQIMPFFTAGPAHWKLLLRQDAAHAGSPHKPLRQMFGEQQDVPNENLKRLREPKSPMVPDAPTQFSIAAHSRYLPPDKTTCMQAMQGHHYMGE